MLLTHEKFKMIDKGRKNDFFAEVNWDKDNVATNNCQVVKFSFPDGNECYVDKKHLVEMIFAIGTSKEQSQLIPQTIRKSRWYETVLSVKAKKNIQKGENITFPLKITLPTVEEEVIGELKKDVAKTGNLPLL